MGKNISKLIFSFVVFMAVFSACKVSQIVIEPKEVELGIGEVKQLKVVTVPGNVRKNVNTFTSSDENIVRVEPSGLIEGVSVGEAIILVKPSRAKENTGAECKVVVSGVIRVNADDTILTAAGKTLRYSYFKSEEEFLKKVYAFNKLELNGLGVDEFTLEELVCDEEQSVLALSKKFVVGQRLPSDFFGAEQTLEGERSKSYNTKFSKMTISAKGITIPIVWDDSLGDDSLTIPEDGSFVLSPDNFAIIEPDANLLTAKLVLYDLKLLISQAYDDGSETGDGTVSITVKGNDNVVGTATSLPISNEIQLDLSGFTQRENDLTFELAIVLNSGKAPTMINNSSKRYIFPKVKTIISKNLDINPLFVSIVRDSSERGVVAPRGSVLLNYGGEIESALKQMLGGDFRSYNWDDAVWSGKIINSENGAVLATITDAPYKKRTVFDLSLERELQVKLSDAKIVATHNKLEETELVVSMAWGSEKIFGDSIKIPNKKDFPETVKINNGLVSDTGETYALVFGDDFNYHYNGLNYKTTNSYHAVKNRPDIDYEANRYNKNWGLEVAESQPFLRRTSAWDIRNAETKNGVLFSKALACDPATGTIFLGHGKTKAIDGYSDLLPGVDHLTGRTRSKTVKYGYVEGRVRVRNKAYNDAYIRGPWYAFWLHGDMHEYDIMEFCNEGRVANLVIHWHNGWTNFGKNPGSSWIKYNCPENWGDEWWTLGLYWDETKVVWTYNGKEMARMSATDNNAGVSFSFPAGTNAWNNGGASGSRNLSGVATSYTKDLNPQIAGGTTPMPYTGGKLKGIMDVPMNIFAASTESSSSWGGVFPGAGKLPTWMEVEYVAYYLPARAIEEIKITASTTTTVKVGKDIALAYQIIPAQTEQREVEWISSDPSVATVDENGVVKALSLGSATITCRSIAKPSVFDEILITVADELVMPTSIVVTPSELDVYDGDDVVLSATVFPANATDKSVRWNSSDLNIASVSDDGKIFVLNRGVVTITATSAVNPSVSGSATLRVLFPPTRVVINQTGRTLDLDDAVASPIVLSASIEPAKALQDIRWESSDTNVATVSENGTVTFKAIGTVSIWAISVEDENIKASISYTIQAFTPVNAPNSISVGGNTFTLAKAFNFDNSNDVILQDNHSIASDRLTINGLHNECTVKLTNIGKYDAMSIHYKYNGVSPNLDASFGSDVCHYTFYRPGANISVSTGAAWNPRQFNVGSFGADENNYFTQHVVAYDGQIYMTKGTDVKSGALTKQGEWEDSVNIYFRDQDSGNRGTLTIDYIAFYVGKTVSLTDDIVRDGQTYSVVKLFEFNDTTGISMNDNTITHSVSGGALTINFPNTHETGNPTLDFENFSENADYMEIKLKASPVNSDFAPHLSVNIFQCAFFTNSSGGTGGGGYTFRVGPLHSVNGAKLDIVDNQYIKLGYVFDGTKSHKFFKNGEKFTIDASSTNYASPSPANSGFKLFIQQFKAGAGTITIDYVAFYKKK